MPLEEETKPGLKLRRGMGERSRSSLANQHSASPNTKVKKLPILCLKLIYMRYLSLYTGANSI